MAKIAILGFGTVGSGVYEVLCHNAASVSRRAGEPVEVKYILDPKDFTGNPVEPLVVKNIDVILQDPEIRVVVETIGGTRFAYPYVTQRPRTGRRSRAPWPAPAALRRRWPPSPCWRCTRCGRSQGRPLHTDTSPRWCAKIWALTMR